MTQLEAGKIAIFNFGKDVKMLHDLTTVFNDEEGRRHSFSLSFCLTFQQTPGEKVCNSFSFNQDCTSIQLCLKQVVLTLQRSFEKKNAQLAFIVSDGKFDSGEREEIKRWTRIGKRIAVCANANPSNPARESNQLVVLIIVEAKESQSILDLKQATLNEKGELKINKYLDDYPFPYYIIVSEMNELPQVLADALRQWFEILMENE